MNIINFLISVILVFAQRQWKTTSEGGGDLYQRPRFVHSPDPVFAVENEETIIKCRAKGAKFFLWTKSRKMSLKQSLSGRLTGMPLRGLKRFSVPGNDRNLPRENGDLIIKQTKLADEGFYSCFPTNHWGSISATTSLKVRPASAPDISWRPEATLTAKAGASATIKCRVLGWPRPKVKWLFREKLEYADKLVFGSRFKTLFDGHLVIEEVRDYDSGFYKCIAINKYGSAIAEGRLQVNGAKRYEMDGCDGYLLILSLLTFATLHHSLFTHEHSTGLRDMG